jgi:hypothetical protein
MVLVVVMVSTIFWCEGTLLVTALQHQDSRTRKHAPMTTVSVTTGG